VGPEAAIEALLNKRVRSALGGMTVKLAPTTVGIPDRLVILPGGRLYLVELKAPNGRVSASQKHLHEVLRGMGVRVAVLHSQAEVLEWIAERASDRYYKSLKELR
jgi:hypothetical protein